MLLGGVISPLLC